jgi:hypothetical protein
MRKKNNRGFGLIFFTFFLIAFLGMISLVVDVAHMYVSKQELQNVADNASLAAVAAFLQQDEPSLSGIQTAVERVIDNTVLRNVIDDIDITVGKFDVNEDERFVPLAIDDPLANAARVTVASNRIGLYFARIFGMDTARASAFATSSAVSRNILLAIDYSGSTDNSTYTEGVEYFRTQAWQNLRLPEPMTSIIDAASAFVDIGEGYLTVNDSVGLIGMTGYLYNDGIWKTTAQKEVRVMAGSLGMQTGFGVPPEMLRAGGVRRCLRNAREYYSWYIDHRGIYSGAAGRTATLPADWWNRASYGLDLNNNNDIDRDDFQRLQNNGYALFTNANFDYLDVSEPREILTHNELVNIFAPRILLNWQDGAASATAGEPAIFPACTDWNTRYRYSDNGPRAAYDTNLNEVINTKTNIGGAIQLAKDHVFGNIPDEQSANAARIMIIISDWQSNVDATGNMGATLTSCYNYVRNQAVACDDLGIVIHGIGIGQFRSGVPLENHASRCLNAATNETGGLQWRISPNNVGNLREQLRDIFDQISKIVPYVIVE